MRVSACLSSARVVVLSTLLLPQFATAANPPVSQALYNKFVRYTKFSAASYASSCPNPPGSAVVVKYFDESSTDTQAVLFRDDVEKELILAWRGTSSIQDFVSDLDQKLTSYTSTGVSCNGCKVHAGYLKQWNSVSSSVISTVRSATSANANYNLTVTGHSMGGSLAVLAAASLLGSGFDLTTYTLGEPRTGDPAFAAYIDKIMPEGMMFRITHTNDGVPQTFTTADGSRHHKTEYWANDPPSAANTVKCSGNEPTDCNNSVRGTGIGANGIGINLAHLNYFGISIGNPLNPGLSQCNGLG